MREVTLTELRDYAASLPAGLEIDINDVNTWLAAQCLRSEGYPLAKMTGFLRGSLRDSEFTQFQVPRAYADYCFFETPDNKETNRTACELVTILDELIRKEELNDA